MSIKEHPPQHVHVPVLLEKTLEYLRPQEGESYLDVTAGYGGHARRVLECTNNFSDAVLVDRDQMAIESLDDLARKGTLLVQNDFADATEALVKQGKTFNMILVDLGVSSPQLDYGHRGFSFTHDGPLDMRMDQGSGRSAEVLVNTLPSKELERILVQYGEEPRGSARRIAKAIVQHRPFTTTKELADVILATHRGKWQKTHPATRTFQALRIATNDELAQIERMLPLLPTLLTKGGRLAVISFHSLEDRLVKRFMKEQASAGYEAELALLEKRAISGATEDVHNPRARSAKLRVAVKK
ncbi:16S rRNA (cytosine(1402)-N(4))-methyltransferase RsmH [Candidatus Saccharibacteria bacterium]|jgi:16S rRNA (cytosine1402-N4)-methyltransferase|nr:16S rRNA (cytosine(1402)-N(4))-methyltransferase RsmH [Candidatus Saccharibacteria bacterium]